ncbi:thiol reductant ABC exporter subunit CydD [Agarivorans gilvus]|nr:thiol reductant ABC exporter subunit CydD [Agarivorans gilvus]
MRPIRPQLLFATCLAILSVPLLLLQMYCLAMLCAALLQLEAPKPLLWYGLLASFLLRQLLLSAKDFLAQQASRQLRQNLRNTLWQGLAQLGPARQKFGSDGQLSSLLTEHVDALDGYISRYWSQQYLVMVTPLAIAVVVSQHSLLAAGLLLGTAPLVPVFMILVGKEASKASSAQLQQQSRMSGRLYDFLSGLSLLKRLNAVPVASQHLSQAAEYYRQSTMQVLKLAFLSTAVLELFSSLAIALVALYLGLGLLGELPWLKQQIAVSYPSALFILLLAPEFYQALRQLGNDYHAKAQAQSATVQLMPLWRAIDPATQQTQQQQALPSQLANTAAFSLQLQDILVGQAQQPRLQLDRLTIATGQRILLSGPSGSGKSTLLQLLAGFVPFHGQLMLNDVSIAKAQMPALRQQIAYLNQHAELMPGSVAENLALAKTDAQPQQMIAVLKAVELWDYLVQYGGLNYSIGEQGLGLSGGQQQRLAFARLLLQPRAIWLLDEPFAELDQASISSLSKVLEQISRGKTLLIASHQWQGLDFVDGCLLLEQGHLLKQQPISLAELKQLSNQDQR